MRTRGSWVLGLGACLSLMACGDGGEGAGDDSSAGKAPVLDASADRYGKSYDEWAAAWWQWIAASPGGANAVTDATGALCGIGQDPESPVSFLAGTWGGSVRRDCAYPAEKALFFPIINWSADNGCLPPDDHKAEEEWALAAAEWLSGIDVGALELEVDGVSVTDFGSLKQGPSSADYRLRDGECICMDWGMPVDHCGVEVTGATMVGYYAMLAPLAKGSHTVSFSATMPGAETPVRVDYSLTAR